MASEVLPGPNVLKPEQEASPRDRDKVAVFLFDPPAQQPRRVSHVWTITRR